jgi:hypothetical protein
MITYCIENLTEIELFLKKISQEVYVYPSKMLSGATIGQHMRHLLEFYVTAIQGLENKTFSYDDRKRTPAWENSKQEALSALSLLLDRLNGLDQNHNPNLNLECGFGGEERVCLESNFFRELAYCLEHSIHHQALIKVSLLEAGQAHLISGSFGVAPSTLKHHSTLAAQN